MEVRIIEVPSVCDEYVQVFGNKFREKFVFQLFIVMFMNCTRVLKEINI